jgi:hypothetical protein
MTKSKITKQPRKAAKGKTASKKPISSTTAKVRTLHTPNKERADDVNVDPALLPKPKRTAADDYNVALEAVMTVITSLNLPKFISDQLLSIIQQDDAHSYSLLAEIEKYIHTITEDESRKQLSEAIRLLTRPLGSFLHSESPTPSAFMQHDVLYVDLINCHVDQVTKDPKFWWSPVSDPFALEMIQAINSFKKGCSQGLGVNFCFIRKETESPTGQNNISK